MPIRAPAQRGGAESRKGWVQASWCTTTASLHTRRVLWPPAAHEQRPARTGRFDHHVGRSSSESCNSEGAAPAAGGAPRARSLLLPSRGRRPGNVVGCGRGSTGRATSRAARLRECRRGDGRAQLDRVYKANTAPEPSARKVKKKCISREPDRLPTVESVPSKYRGGQTWQLAFLFLDGRTRHLTRLRLTGSRGSEAEAAEDAAAGAATRVVAPARIQSR